MRAVTMSTKGQLVLPKEVRDALGIKGGSRLEVEVSGGAVLLRPAKKGKAVRVEDCVGILPNTVGPVAVDEMDGGRILARFGAKRPL